MNEQLLEVVHRVKGEDPGGTLLSNIGGWHSGRSFLEPPSIDALPQPHSDALRSLRLHILEQVSEFVSALAVDETATPYITLHESW